MHPCIETMISDIVRWLEKPLSLDITFDDFDGQSDRGVFVVSVGEEAWRQVWRHTLLIEALAGAWSFCDQIRDGDRLTQADFDELREHFVP